MHRHSFGGVQLKASPVGCATVQRPVEKASRRATAVPQPGRANIHRPGSSDHSAVRIRSAVHSSLHETTRDDSSGMCNPRRSDISCDCSPRVSLPHNLLRSLQKGGKTALCIRAALAPVSLFQSHAKHTVPQVRTASRGKKAQKRHRRDASTADVTLFIF